ncbi:MAG TPA: alpha/beta fold hydrolase [Solirubrobacteraceae bacterium]|nr:alpha/beta fold hydrolase [Solirubrobacteraceae bacterium]
MELAHDRTGSGPALVLLHPLGADRHVWEPVVPALAAERTVVAVDLPGFGRTPALTGVTPTPAALAEAVADGLARLELPADGDGRVHVAGNSLGGWVALELALRGVAASVTAIAPAGLWPEPLLPKASSTHILARALEPLALAALGSPRGRRALLGGTIVHPERMTAAQARRLVRAYGRAPGFIAVNDAMRAGRLSELDRITVPVTLVWPDHDRLVRRPVSVPERMRSVVLRDAGHIPMWDAPEELVAMLLAGSAQALPEALRGPGHLR